MIAQWMATVEPLRYPERPMCNDDDGMLISQVVDSVMCIDKKAFGILLSYYSHGSTEYAIASYYHKTAKYHSEALSVYLDRHYPRAEGRLRIS